METVKGIGRGVKGLFRRGKAIAETAAADASSGDSVSAGTAAGTLLRVDGTKRKLAEGVGADPYSSNARLQQELQPLAQAAIAGSLTTSFAFPSIPGFNEISTAGRLVWSQPPEALAERNRQSLEGIGCSGDCTGALLDNETYTPSLQTAFVLALEQLDGLAGRAELVSVAATADTEVEARFYVRSAEMLADFAAEGRTLTRAAPKRRALAALDEDLGLLVVAPVDVLSWDEELAVAARETTPGSATRELWVTGVIADRARLELQQLDWIVHERAHR